MRVLHVIPSLSPLRGGPSFAVVEMVKSLIGHGVDAEIVTTDDNLPNLASEKKKVKIIWEQVPAFFFHRLNSPVKAIGEYSLSPAFISWMKENIRKYDVVHTHAVFSFLPSYARHLSYKMKIPCVARTMGHLDPWSLRNSKMKKKIALLLFEKKRLLNASVIHATSNSEASNINKLLGDHINVATIPLGIKIPEGGHLSKSDSRRFLGFKEDDKLIIFQSRLHPKKRVELLFNVLVKIPFAKLVIAGRGDHAYENYLKKLSRSLRLEGRVIWLGWLDGARRGALLKAGDVFALPSLSENFGLAALEAASCGITSVLSEHVDVGIRLSELGAALICKDDDYVGIIKRVLEAPGNYQFDVDKILREFDWNNIGLNLKQLYLRIVNN